MTSGFIKASYWCPICNKQKSQGNHKKCSKQIQKMYAKDTELGKARAQEIEARKLYFKSDPTIRPTSKLV